MISHLSLFSAGRTRFNNFLEDTRQASAKMKQLINAKFSIGALSTSKFKELLDEWKRENAPVA